MSAPWSSGAVIGKLAFLLAQMALSPCILPSWEGKCTPCAQCLGVGHGEARWWEAALSSDSGQHRLKVWFSSDFRGRTSILSFRSLSRIFPDSLVQYVKWFKIIACKKARSHFSAMTRKQALQVAGVTPSCPERL